ncbi:MAG: CoA transferase [Xanthomonadales bacterium]|nr:CoA transferase [Xanthomonadales bacterium]
MGKPLPLAGIRILAVEQYGAAPYGSQYLAELGAEVIKIESPPAGDVARRVGPFELGPDDSEFFQTFNGGKKSLRLDLKHPKGREVFERLVATADAVLDNLRGDQPAKLGLDYPSLSRIKPAIVCAHLSAYGRDNRRAAWPGYDYLMQAEAGFCHLTGEPGTPPARFGLSVVDFMTGMVMAIGLLAALLDARRTGIGRDVDVSLFEVALHQLSYPATWYLNHGHLTTRLPRGAHPATVPAQSYRTRDGWVFVLCMLPKFWEELCRGLGREDLLSDPRFVDFAARRRHRDELTELLDAAFMTRTTAEWLERFQGRIPIAPVYDLAQGLDNPFVAEIGMIESLDHPLRPGLRRLACPIRLDGERPPGAPAPALDADAPALLAELGYSPAEIAELRALFAGGET